MANNRNNNPRKYIKTDDFVEIFSQKFKALKIHDFIAKGHLEFCISRKESKESSSEGEILVMADFSENYSFILQGAGQGFLRNNPQTTMHLFVVCSML